MNALWLTAIMIGNSAASAGVYLRNTIARVDDEPECLASGKILGRPVLAACLRRNQILLVSYASGAWTHEKLPVEFHPSFLAIAEGRDDGIARIYVASKYDPRVLELEATGRGSWKKSFVTPAGFTSQGLRVMRSRMDGRPRLIIERVKSRQPTATGDVGDDLRVQRCGERAEYSLIECAWNRIDWTCAQIGTPCSGAFLVNPWPGESRDIIIGPTIFARLRDGWKEFGGMPKQRNMVPLRRKGAIVVDDGEFQVSEGLEAKQKSELPIALIGTNAAVWGPGVDEVAGEFRSLAIGSSSLKGVERVFASDDTSIYELVRDSAGWRLDSKWVLQARPNDMIYSDLRSEGANRLYVAERTIQHGTVIEEFSFFPEPLSVVTSDFMPRDAGVVAISSGVERVLGDVFRARLATLEHLRIGVGPQADKIAFEAAFVDPDCAGGDCRSRPTVTPTVLVRIANELRMKGEVFVLSAVATEVQTQRELFRLERLAASERELLSAAEALAEDCGKVWPLMSQRN